VQGVSEVSVISQFIQYSVQSQDFGFIIDGWAAGDRAAKIWWRVLINRRHLIFARRHLAIKTRHLASKTRHQISKKRHQISKTWRLFSVRSLKGKRAR
jgi:hypothetical protein